jgi:hypothetical protein
MEATSNRGTLLTASVKQHLSEPVSVLEEYCPPGCSSDHMLRIIGYLEGDLDVQSIEQLLRYSPRSILAVPGISTRSLECIYEALERMGFMRYNLR